MGAVARESVIFGAGGFRTPAGFRWIPISSTTVPFRELGRHLGAAPVHMANHAIADRRAVAIRDGEIAAQSLGIDL
jgi:hypothetical protein